MTVTITPGQCDPALCNVPNNTFINFGTNNYSICTLSGARSISNGVPIKQLLKGTSVVPWVRLRFEGDNCPPAPFNTGCNPAPGGNAPPQYWDYTEITTGNISQPGNSDKCRAAIKSFQYAWGAIQSGNVCKIVIHDEAGSTFDAWFKRIFRNPILQDNQNTSVNKMKVTFGWILSGANNTNCPAVVNPSYNGTCPANGGSPDNTNTMICSPVLWFMPVNLVCNMQQGGKFIYELEGRDMLMAGQNFPIQRVFGDDISELEKSTGKTHFLDAVVKLGYVAQPPFNVQFAQLSEDGNSNTNEQLQFWKDPNQATARIVIPGYMVPHNHYVDQQFVINTLDYYVPVTANQGSCLPGNLFPDGSCSAGPATVDDLIARGPLGRYDTGNKDAAGAINSWLPAGVRANSPATERDGKGLTFNYDPTFDATGFELPVGMPTKGTMLVWGDAGAGSIRNNNSYNARKMATYIVNGGKCSPVFSFMPNIKFYWSALNVGGAMGPNTGETQNVREDASQLGTGLPKDPYLNQGAGSASVVVTPTPTSAELDRGEDAMRSNVRSMQEHWVTNSIHDTIEAELKVQGDPSFWLCSPIEGNGRNVAIVVINPFFLTGGTNATGCQWSQYGTPSPCVCHDILTNVNWWVKGVEHIIKEGSYVTNLKVSLTLNPNIPANDPECGCPIGPSGDSDAGGGYCGSSEWGLCEQGTQPCAAYIPEGGADVFAGAGSIPIDPTNTFCGGPDINQNFNPCYNDLIVG